MIRANTNLLKGRELALSISQNSQYSKEESSSSWFVSQGDANIAIWANDSSIANGCITAQLADELSNFLNKAIASSAERVILFLDSAGVELSQGWRAMKHAASLIKQLLSIRIKHAITTVAVLGDTMGCYGGAFLVASTCQYIIGTKDGLCGVSGRKVIEHLDHATEEMNRLFYQAEYRLINQELFCILPDPQEERRNLLLMLEHHPLTRDELQQEFTTLQTSAKKDRLALQDKTYEVVPANNLLGFPQSKATGCDELLYFIEQLMPYLDSDSELPLIMGNCEQEFSFINEQKGFSRYLSLCIKLLRYLSEQGRKVSIKVDQQGSGATFIAVSMMADNLIIEDGSLIHPLPVKAMNLFIDQQSIKGDEWKYNN